MDRRTVAGTLWSVVLAGGLAAMIGATALPDPSPYLTILTVVGGIAIAVGLIGLVFLFFTAPKAPPLPKRKSTFVKARGGAEILLDDSQSSADTYFDADEASKISSTNNRHNPGPDN